MSIIFSENPETDLWREISQFSYDENIKRYLSKRGIEANQSVLNCISGAFLQAYEYYRASKDANLQISPLLLYYGSTNLLYGMTSLLSGKVHRINNHGMKIKDSHFGSFISDTIIRFNNPGEGGVHVFARALGFDSDLTNYGDWKLREFLDSIAEINADYIQCYGESVGRIAMLDVFDTPDGKAEKVYFSEDNMTDMENLLANVEGLHDSYLPPVIVNEARTGKQYYVLRHKLTGEDISERSYSGQPYLRAGHIKNKKLVTIPTILNMYISLFVLATLCRYSPECWSPFVLRDTTGEKLLIEKLLYFARRLIPNYVLNALLDRDIYYGSSWYKEHDKTALVGEHQVQEIVQQAIKNGLEINNFNIK